MEIILGGAGLGIKDRVLFAGDNITVVPEAFDGFGNAGPVPTFPPLGVFRREYTKFYIWDTTNSGAFSVIRVVNNEPVMIPVEDEPFEIRLGDAICFGSQPEVFILWVEWLACWHKGGSPFVSHEEWCAVCGDD